MKKGQSYKEPAGYLSKASRDLLEKSLKKEEKEKKNSKKSTSKTKKSTKK